MEAIIGFVLADLKWPGRAKDSKNTIQNKSSLNPGAKAGAGAILPRIDAAGHMLETTL